MSAWPTDPCPSTTGVRPLLRKSTYWRTRGGLMPVPPNSAVFSRINMAARTVSGFAGSP